MVCLLFLVPTKCPQQDEFNFVGQVPQTMLRRIPITSLVLQEYRKTLVTPYPIRHISDPKDVATSTKTLAAKSLKKRKGTSEVSTSSEVSPSRKKKTIQRSRSSKKTDFTKKLSQTQMLRDIFDDDDALPISKEKGFATRYSFY